VTSQGSSTGEGSHSEMGRENIMTCRAKTYGFMEEGQKEKMEGSGTLSTQGTNNLLNGAYPPEECGSQRLDMYWGRVSSRELLVRVRPSIFVIRKEPPSFTSVTTEGPFVNLGLASFS
jgi:hypothetical protein